MLKILQNTKLETPNEIEERYPQCKYILTDFDDLNDMKGHLYAVSPNKQSFLELCKLCDHLVDEGRVCIIMGEYEGSMMIGVQSEIKG